MFMIQATNKLFRIKIVVFNIITIFIPFYQEKNGHCFILQENITLFPGRPPVGMTVPFVLSLM